MRLPSQGVGGYVWEAEVLSGPGRVVKQPTEVDSELIGGGGAASFLLNWDGTSGGRVRFAKKRPWEDQPTEEHIIDITSD